MLFKKSQTLCLSITETVQIEPEPSSISILYYVKYGFAIKVRVSVKVSLNNLVNFTFSYNRTVLLAAIRRLLHRKSWRIHLREVPTAHTLLPRFDERKYRRVND